MYLLYLDASGTPELSDRNTRHYVLLGVCLHERDWSAVTDDIRQLKARYELPGVPFELHVKQFAVTIKDQDRIDGFENLTWERRREAVLALRRDRLAAADRAGREKMRARFRSTDPFVHLTRSERSQLLEDAVGLFGGYSGLRLFADVVSKTHPAVVDGRVLPFDDVFSHVIPRFDKFLDNMAWRTFDRDPYRRPPDHGLLILDRDIATEASYHDLFQRLRRDGSRLGKLRHVIDVPFFADGEQAAGLQFADVAAYVTRRYLDTAARVGSHEERQFRAIFPRFDRDGSGRLHGIRHYVPANSCSCLICCERGHGPEAG